MTDYVVSGLADGATIILWREPVTSMGKLSTLMKSHGIQLILLATQRL